MATIPKATAVKAGTDNAQFLNTMRARSSFTYQERIPLATQDNLSTVYSTLLNYQPFANEFLNNLINLVGKQIITSRAYENQLRRFKKGILEFGESVEEVFVNMAKAHQYNPEVAETQWMRRELPDVDAVFHRFNYRNFYKVTIQNHDLRSAFLSWNGIETMIAKITDSLYSGAEADEYLIMKNMLTDAATQGDLYAINVPTLSDANAREIAIQIKAMSNLLVEPSAQYNPMGVVNFTPKSRQILILNAYADAVLDVGVLAMAFNMDKAEFMGQRVMIGTFTDMPDVVAVLVDEDFFQIWEREPYFTENYNGEGAYWNYWLHRQMIFSRSPFSNGIVFTTGTPAVTGVTVNPSTATVAPGGTVRFTAIVASTGLAPQTVNWTVNSDKSSITQQGELTVGPGETASTLTVTATSRYDNSQTGTATVTVS